MTPTSDERREMAEQLRKHNGHYYEELVNMSDSDLADLIDPTCHNQHTRPSDGCFCCSECLFLYEPTDWSACRNGFLYCPRCGARVVRGGED